MNDRMFTKNGPVKQVDNCKTLGVNIDKHLSWKNNTESICKKVASGICNKRYACIHI
jgi:hypothetical protein